MSVPVCPTCGAEIMLGNRCAKCILDASIAYGTARPMSDHRDLVVRMDSNEDSERKPGNRDAAVRRARPDEVEQLGNPLAGKRTVEQDALPLSAHDYPRSS